MQTYTLPFAQINILRDDIAEVIVNHGVEFDLELVRQYHEFLLSHLTAPFSLLINKINSYSYDFEAQQNIATLTEINVMAVVTYNEITHVTTETLASYPRKIDWELSFFTDREAALAWLLSMQAACQEQNHG